MTSTSGHPLSILVVEDDEHAGPTLVELLREDGFVAELCADGQAGCARLAAGPLPDVLLTDLRMPVLDGAAVARAARDRDPAMPVLVMTAYPHLFRLADVDPSELFVKPLDYPRLVRTLSDLRDAPR